MVFISKLFTLLVLPPGCIVIGLILIIIFIPRKYKLFLALITALLYILSIRPMSDLLLRPLEDAFPPLSGLENGDFEPEAIVLLGGGVILGSPDSSGDSLSADAVKRAVYAFTLRDDFPGPYILSGGRVAAYNKESEAEVMERLFLSIGLPPERILLETTSRNTWENARETAKRGYQQVILVTSAYHMRRSVFCFERNGMTVIPAPTDYKCDRGRSYSFLCLLPAVAHLGTSCLALREYIGLLSYRILH
jgi:uncharacterized SAM-binding protein YcdF (DUF218 family)